MSLKNTESKKEKGKNNLILGVSGSGMSFTTKREMINTFLKTK